MKLVDQSLLSLDRPLAEYLPAEEIVKILGHPLDEKGFHREWLEKITARHILSHSSGFPHGETGKPVPLAFEPGAHSRRHRDPRRRPDGGRTGVHLQDSSRRRDGDPGEPEHAGRSDEGTLGGRQGREQRPCRTGPLNPVTRCTIAWAPRSDRPRGLFEFDNWTAELACLPVRARPPAESPNVGPLEAVWASPGEPRLAPLARHQHLEERIDSVPEIRADQIDMEHGGNAPQQRDEDRKRVLPHPVVRVEPLV